MYICIYLYVCMCMHMYMELYCAYVYIYIHVYICMHMYMCCAYVYVYIHVCWHCWCYIAVFIVDQQLSSTNRWGGRSQTRTTQNLHCKIASRQLRRPKPLAKGRYSCVPPLLPFAVPPLLSVQVMVIPTCHGLRLCMGISSNGISSTLKNESHRCLSGGSNCTSSGFTQ